VALSRYLSFLCVFSELQKRLLERHFSPAGIKPVLADYLSQSLSNDSDVKRRIPRKKMPNQRGAFAGFGTGSTYDVGKQARGAETSARRARRMRPLTGGIEGGGCDCLGA
jgi:hypothetical protein